MLSSSFSRTVLVLGFLFVGTTNSFAGTTLDRIKQTGVVNLGFREDSLPFSYKNAEQGDPLGYSIDVCNALVDALKAETGKPLTVKYVPVTGESRFPYVVDGKIDLECGNSTNTKARREKVAFSMPLYFSSAKLLVREGSGITKFSDLAGKTLAVENGSTGQQIAESRKAAMNTMKVVIAPSSDAGVVAVETKTADAFMTDDILLYAFKAQSKEKLEVAGAVMSIEPLAISFSKDDKELATIVDREFTKLTQSGQLRKLYKKWFQTTLPQRSYNLNVVPNQLTSEVLIRPSNYVADWTVF
ncbi:MAG: amino acid ABC transporter substrate-binding protein [Propionivibrio sp.]|nr:amino acid ABC transporter substrate-binding protein [Propionivibrio sp.]MBP7524489.1 amino acid ABC transporter substrate-binding protein [Propionivibrio sp.]MBP8162692.1 amino acid ABC transporter substrate-binding protein [Propionivibrio sp.]